MPLNTIRKVANFGNPSDIDSFKSVITRRGGLASPRRFAIVLRPPERSLFNLDIRDIAIRVVSGTFRPGQLFNDPRDLSILCTNVSLPGRTINTEDRVLQVITEKSATSTTPNEISVSFVMTNDFHIRKLMDNWQNSIVNRVTRTVAYENEYKAPMTVMQLNSRNIPIYSVRLSGVFPTSVNSLELDSAGDIAGYRVTVTFSYDDFDVIPVEGAVKDLIPFEDLSPGNVLRDLRGSLPF